MIGVAHRVCKGDVISCRWCVLVVMKPAGLWCVTGSGQWVLMTCTGDEASSHVVCDAVGSGCIRRVLVMMKPAVMWCVTGSGQWLYTTCTGGDEASRPVVCDRQWAVGVDNLYW